jgi:hypothetical protein
MRNGRVKARLRPHAACSGSAASVPGPKPPRQGLSAPSTGPRATTSRLPLLATSGLFRLRSTTLRRGEHALCRALRRPFAGRFPRRTTPSRAMGSPSPAGSLIVLRVELVALRVGLLFCASIPIACGAAFGGRKRRSGGQVTSCGPRRRTPRPTASRPTPLGPFKEESVP